MNVATGIAGTINKTVFARVMTVVMIGGMKAILDLCCCLIVLVLCDGCVMVRQHRRGGLWNYCHRRLCVSL